MRIGAAYPTSGAGTKYDDDGNSMQSPLIEIRGGRRAREQIARDGIEPADIACIPAAAGGPKGLVLLWFDRLLHNEWLTRAAEVELVGASIGAWRMAALAQRDPLRALDRLQAAYVEGQRYSRRPDPQEVSARCRGIVEAVVGDAGLEVRPGIALSILTSRARGPLDGRETAWAFARAGVANAWSRTRLARHLERVVFGSGESVLFDSPFDDFGTTRLTLDTANRTYALLASGSIPLIANAVRSIPGAPPGNYWDGALIDYHLLLPYPRLNATGPSGRGRIVLYPHFAPTLTAGWLDKHLPWRRDCGGHEWLEDVVMICPSREFIATLPSGRLPSREDFYRYGSDHAGRERAWQRSCAESERFAVAAIEWLERPRPDWIRPL